MSMTPPTTTMGSGPPPGPSYALQVSFAIVPKVTAFLSLLGSAFIVYDVALRRDRRRGRKDGVLSMIKSTTTYHRLLLSMSICDILGSAAFFLSTWPIPAGTPYTFQAVGTTQTCSAQGFFINFGTGAVLFNGALSLFYLLSIRNGWKADRLARRVEPWLHALPIVFAAGTSVAGIYLKIYNSSKFTCFIAPLPFRCDQSWRNVENGVPCLRGDNSDIYNWAFNVIPKSVVLILVTVNMWLCHRAVVKLERATNRYRMPSSPATTGSDDRLSRSGSVVVALAGNIQSTFGSIIRRQSSLSQEQQITQQQQQQLSKSKRVARQSFLYVGALYVTLLPGIVNRLSQLITGRGQPVIAMTIALLLPLQGFWNAIVYIRPRYVSARDEQKRRATRVKQVRDLEEAAAAVEVEGEDEERDELHQDSPTPAPALDQHQSEKSGWAAVIAQAIQAMRPRSPSPTMAMAAKGPSDLDRCNHHKSSSGALESVMQAISAAIADVDFEDEMDDFVAETDFGEGNNGDMKGGGDGDLDVPADETLRTDRQSSCDCLDVEDVGLSAAGVLPDQDSASSKDNDESR